MDDREVAAFRRDLARWIASPELRLEPYGIPARYVDGDPRPDLPVVCVTPGLEHPVEELRRPPQVVAHVDPAAYDYHRVHGPSLTVFYWYACRHPERQLDRAVTFHVRPTDEHYTDIDPCWGCSLVTAALAARDQSAPAQKLHAIVTGDR